MLLDGVPLAVRYYEDLGVRPIDHSVVLVPPSRAAHALELVAEDGWTRPGAGGRGDRLDTHVRMRCQHARLLQSPDGEVVELQWQLGAPFVLPGRELESADAFWAAAEWLEVDGVVRRTLCPSDELLDLIVSGLVSRRGGRAQWCADAFVVTSRENELDWDRFVELAESRRLSLVADLALGYLADVLEAAVPATARVRLSRTVRSRHDLRALERSIPDWRARSAGRGLFDLGPGWAWRRAKVSALEAAFDLPGFLQDAWQLPHRYDVPRTAILKLARRVRRTGLRRPTVATGKIVRSWADRERT